MIQYILECIAFQLAFLVIYDFFLKKETFFQWNRVYLIGTYLLSLVLPWIKIEALKTTVPEQYAVYPEFLWNMDNVGVAAVGQASPGFQISWQEGILYGGMLVAAVYFAYKLVQLYRLSRNGSVERFPNFTRIVIANSEMAFSFFRSIFLGDKILAREHSSIIKHELVHIEQRHTLDLLFFEFMRIVGWFNPLVYVYQNRIAELHEFIADAQVPKKERKAHYDLLLSQVFQTQNISFVNQFFKSSLIKKRIVMLQKSKSKKVFQLKYLLLVPIVLGMLAYSSLETKEGKVDMLQQTSEDSVLIADIKAGIEDKIVDLGSFQKVFYSFHEKYKEYPEGEILDKRTYFEREILMERQFTNYMDSLERVRAPFFKRNKYWKKRIPSTARYESYVQHTKAFQLLDKNLQYSIDNRFQNGGTSIKLLDKTSNLSKELLVYKVKNIKDLTGDEVRTFNTKVSEIFETKTSKYKGLVVTDGQHSFEVFDLDLGETVAIENSEDKKLEVITFDQVEKVPVFPGCENDADKRGCFFESMRNHIRKHFNYPKEAQEKGIQGQVNTMFVIDETGAVTKARFRGPDSLLKNEAKRIISRLPKMQPGEHKGEKVQVAFSIPISFKLNSNTAKNEGASQEYNETLDVPFSVVEEVPIFPGCEGATDKRKCFNEMIQKHIAKNFRYPKEAQEKGLQGRVNILLTIGKDGVIKNLRMRGPDVLLENEARRIIDLLPNMVPGKKDGKEVNVPYSIPISFVLDTKKSNQALSNGIPENGFNLNAPEHVNAVYYVDGKETPIEDINKISPDDLASVNVLKGKAAEDKYGEKGKNGVVEITLKKKD